jgi:hypothetical protein
MQFYRKVRSASLSIAMTPSFRAHRGVPCLLDFALIATVSALADPVWDGEEEV